MVWLESERLRFRDHEPSDLDAYCEIESDPEFRSPQVVHPREEIVASFWRQVGIQAPLALRATEFKPDRRYIGRCGLYPQHNDDGEMVPGEATLAFYLARPYWGMGLATEAGAAWIHHAWTELNLHTLHAGVNEQNVRSIRVIEKLGFRVSRTGEGGGNRWRDYILHRP